jgi:uncharacterized protein YyaL (SSP411 family)
VAETQLSMMLLGFVDTVMLGWYDTQADQADLFVRSTNLGDGAVPSGSGTMLLVLLELYELTGEETYAQDATAVFRGISSNLAQNPTGMSRSMQAQDIPPSRLAAAKAEIERILARFPEARTVYPPPRAVCTSGHIDEPRSSPPVLNFIVNPIKS